MPTVTQASTLSDAYSTLSSALSSLQSLLLGYLTDFSGGHASDSTPPVIITSSGLSTPLSPDLQSLKNQIEQDTHTYVGEQSDALVRAIANSQPDLSHISGSSITNSSFSGSALNLTGDFSGTNATLSGDLSVAGNLTVAGSQNLSGALGATYFTANSSNATSSFTGGISVAGANGLTVLQNGYVGVGTIIPAASLQIASGQVLVPSGTVNAPAVAFSNQPSTGIFMPGNGRLQLSVFGHDSFEARYTGLMIPEGNSIIDQDGNPLLSFELSLPAANYLKIRNAHSGSDPILTADGSDANLGISIIPKGEPTSTLSVTGTTQTDDLITAKGPVVDVRSYGAKNDSTTDSSAAIQAAIDDAHQGETLYFPCTAGNSYVVKSPLNFGGKRYLTIKGTGNGCFINYEGTTTQPYAFGLNADVSQFLTFQDIGFETSSANPPEVVFGSGHSSTSGISQDVTFNNVFIGGYATKALFYDIGSEVGRFTSDHFTLWGGGARYVFYTAPYDSLDVGGFATSSNLSIWLDQMDFYNSTTDPVADHSMVYINEWMSGTITLRDSYMGFPIGSNAGTGITIYSPCVNNSCHENDGTVFTIDNTLLENGASFLNVVATDTTVTGLDVTNNTFSPGNDPNDVGTFITVPSTVTLDRAHIDNNSPHEAYSSNVITSSYGPVTNSFIRETVPFTIASSTNSLVYNQNGSDFELSNNLQVAGTSYFTRVGVGTSSPNSLLNIYGTGDQLQLSADAADYANLNAASNGLTINSSANKVTFGSISSASYAQFGLYSAGSLLTLNRVSSGTDNALYFSTADAAQWTIGSWSSDNTNNLSIMNGGLSGNKVLTIDKATGNLGIGTSTPAAKLQITGDDSTALSGSNVVGQLAITGGTNPNQVLQLGYNTSLGSAFIDANVLGSNGRNLILNQTGGAVVIGASTTPSSRLVVQGINNSTGSALNVTNVANSSLFFVQNNGNIGLGTTTPSHLITLSGGAYSDGSVWTNASSRDLKENFATVSPDSILSKINELPVLQWNYKSEDPSIKHIGPIAQDFYSIFHLGNNNTSISTIDPAGIALLGIQALSKEVDALASSTQTVTDISSLADTLSYDAGAIIGGTTHFAELVADKVTATVGIFDHVQTDDIQVKNFIQIDDEDTGAPFCVRVKSGQLVATPGDCTSADDSPDSNQPQGEAQSDTEGTTTSDATDTSVATSSEATTSPAEDVSSSSPEEEGGDTSSNTPPQSDPSAASSTQAQ